MLWPGYCQVIAMLWCDLKYLAKDRVTWLKYGDTLLVSNMKGFRSQVTLCYIMLVISYGISFFESM